MTQEDNALRERCIQMAIQSASGNSGSNRILDCRDGAILEIAKSYFEYIKHSGSRNESSVD